MYSDIFLYSVYIGLSWKRRPSAGHVNGRTGDTCFMQEVGPGRMQIVLPQAVAHSPLIRGSTIWKAIIQLISGLQHPRCAHAVLTGGSGA